MYIDIGTVAFKSSKLGGGVVHLGTGCSRMEDRWRWVHTEPRGCLGTIFQTAPSPGLTYVQTFLL